jgi:type VI secretion system secreted protein VgrG
VGTEVLIAFLGGDPDKPVIVGQLYNQSGRPPALGSADGLPNSRYLSGIKSHEVKGIRANQLRFDDTAGQISAQLSSEHGCSELNLGFLTQPRMNGTGGSRGEGAELRSDNAVAIRGAKGILISANAQRDAVGRLLSSEELAQVAELSCQVADQLAEIAQKHGGDSKDSSALSELAERISNWDTSGLDEKNEAAIVAVNAPAGSFFGSQQALALGAQSSVDITSAKDSRISSGRGLLLRAVRGVSMLAFKCGIKLVAVSGNIRIQAQDGDIEITSLKRIKLVANEGIEIQSPSIQLIAQGSQVRYGGGVITQQSSGVHTIKSSKFTHESGGDGTPEKVSLAATDIEHDQHVLITDFVTDTPLPRRRYRITVEDGQVIEGETDESGLTETFKTKVAFATYQIELLD